MNRDDQLSLNDYIDGRLQPKDQHAVESSCVTNPRLAEELRELTVVRDLVAGLGRDQRVNLAARVMERVRPLRRQRSSRFLSRRSGPLFATLGGGLAVAASLLAVTTALRPARVPVDRADPVVQAGESKLAETSKVIATIDRPVTLTTLTSAPAQLDFARPSPKLAVDSLPVATAASSKRTVPQEPAPSAKTIEELTRLLDNRNLRQIFVVSDTKDGSAQQRVASLVEQTTHFDYFTITVAQGLVIDPMHPDRATVFALVIDPTQLANLRQKLKTAVTSPVEEQSATPELITQLADLGDVKSLKPPAPGEVLIPRSIVAFRSTPGNPSVAEPVAPEQDAASIRVAKTQAAALAAQTGHSNLPPSLEMATAERLPPEAAATSRQGARDGPLDHAESSDPENATVVLIWVRQPHAG